MPRATLAALASGVALLALAGTASADSISYVENGDVRLAAPDGARHLQVTATGAVVLVAGAARVEGGGASRAVADRRVTADDAAAIPAAAGTHRVPPAGRRGPARRP
jgi:hypothetical protein